MTEWSVRLAAAEDFQVVRDMSKMNHEESCPSMEWSERRMHETFFDDFLELKNCMIWVVERAGQVHGFLLAMVCEYRAFRGLFTCQEVLFVKPDKRGTRAAALLMKKLIEWSESIGAREVLGGNDNDVHSEQTARFLSRFGFRQFGYAMRLDLHGR